jgi:adenosylhomocysteine nucleosidase
MTSTPSPLPCIVFALARESMAFRRWFRPRVRIAGAPCRAWLAGPVWRTVLLLETGIGGQAMATALTWLFGDASLGSTSLRPQRVLLAGFAGGLSEGQEVGEVVAVSEVCDTEGGTWPIKWPDDLAPELRRGRLLTVPHLVADVGEKRLLGERHQAMVVDMESAVAARLCHAAGVPFVCLRSISDDWRTPLSPQLTDLLVQGRIAPLRLTAAVLRRPWLIVELWRLARQTRLAANRLAAGLRRVLGLN